MAEAKKFLVQKALDQEIQDIDKRYLRSLQKDMHDCSAKCCSNTTASVQEIDVCVARCSAKLTEATKYTTSQLNNFQARLQRCVNQCNDDAKGMMGLYPTESEVGRASSQFEACASRCIDQHLDQLPHFVKNMHENLSKQIPPNSDLRGVDV